MTVIGRIVFSVFKIAGLICWRDLSGNRKRIGNGHAME
jgi:hypothetical protein